MPNCHLQMDAISFQDEPFFSKAKYESTLGGLRSSRCVQRCCLSRRRQTFLTILALQICF